MKISKSGFTIVELLIVIVVIGILSAITVVAYNGVQHKAAMARVHSSLATYEKALLQYKTLNDSYPISSDVCLGTTQNYPVKNGFAAGSCRTTPIAIDTTLNTTLMQVISTLPDGSTPVVSISGAPAARGISYSSNGTTAELVYYLSGANTSCGFGTRELGIPANLNFTVCFKSLN